MGTIAIEIVELQPAGVGAEAARLRKEEDEIAVLERDAVVDAVDRPLGDPRQFQGRLRVTSGTRLDAVDVVDSRQLDAEAAATALATASKALDKAASKKVIHPNLAARKKSQLAKMLNKKTAASSPASSWTAASCRGGVSRRAGRPRPGGRGPGGRVSTANSRARSPPWPPMRVSGPAPHSPPRRTTCPCCASVWRRS